MLHQVPFNLLFSQSDWLEPLYLDSPPEGLSSKGPYPILDLYCQDYACDCHKVSMAILEEGQEKILGTIAYGWKSRMHYYKWGLDRDATRSLTDGFLDPLCTQTAHSPFFLSVIRRKINREPGFISQIKKRYRIFKDYVEDPLFIPLAPPPRDLPDNVVSLDAHRRKTA